MPIQTGTPRRVLNPALLPACRFQRIPLGLKSEVFSKTYESNLPPAQPPAWPILSIFRMLGFFFRVVLPEVGTRMSQPPAGTLLDPRKPFCGRMGSPGSQCRAVEPMTTVLTAGSTEQSTPHHCRVTHCMWPKETSSPDADIVMKKDGGHRVRMQHSGPQGHGGQRPGAVSGMLFQ